MRKVRDVLRLKHTLGMSLRQISEATGVGKTVVGEYLRRAGVIGITWPVPEEIDDAELPTYPPILGDWTAEFGYRAGRELLATREFSAVFAASDHMALGLLHALWDAGLKIPADVSVVGFDDIPDARHFAPPLTTIRQDFGEIGRRAFEVLLSELNGEKPTERAQIPPELVVRASTGRAPGSPRTGTRP